MRTVIALSFLLTFFQLSSQNIVDPSMLTIDRIYASSGFQMEVEPPIQWIEDGNAYVIKEYNSAGENLLIRYATDSQNKTTYLSTAQLTPEGVTAPITISDFSLSPDASKALLFTNTSRVWRTNTKGDYWVYDFDSGKLSQLGINFSASSLMFAKFSVDNRFVAYVQDFNLYKEEFSTGEITQLTFDGNRDIINGTFDWVYEEEFGCRDGFRWSPDAEHIVFWQLDASDIKTFYMINNTDSIYSQLIPLQYPKVGEEPSACRVGVVNINNQKVHWIPIPGGAKENYIPAVQWLNEDELIIQQINRKQNHLIIWKYNIQNGTIKSIYEEREKTWVDLSYPDISSSNWGENDVVITADRKSFLRMTENDSYRHIYKINIEDGLKTLLTIGDYDVAQWSVATDELLYFHASPTNSTQRYLYSVDLFGKGDTLRLTPYEYSGVNVYNISPNGAFAFHRHSSSVTPPQVHLVSLKDHRRINTILDNSSFKAKTEKLAMPNVSFFQVTTEEGITIDGKMIKPYNFDPNQQYPVIFNVYGEPWGQMATDTYIGLWNILLTQQGYVLISMDNRGTPCLKGSEWRKSIYRKIGLINTRDQALAAKEVLKWDFIDDERVGVYGWSGGGSMTLNLLFQFSEIYHVGISGAPVAYQLYYDNIYQERYMGLPQENMEDFIAGSPVTYAQNLKGKLLLIHGTGDDNVHYQNSERLINELIKHNKQFDFMSYPNRSHSAREGKNTVRHKAQLMFNYFNQHLLD